MTIPSDRRWALTILALAALGFAGCSDSEPAGPTACSSTSCPLGCCSATGTCVMPVTTLQCGGGGSLCKACGAGQSCTNGTCSGGSTSGCSHSTCAEGCCTPGGECVKPPTDYQCGTGGTICKPCDPNQTCTLGACVAKQQNCDTCKDAGCCHQGTECLPGTAATACGKDGEACQKCTDGKVCDEGTCIALEAPCDATSCKGGCCSSTGCVPYDKQGTASCGKDGNDCEVCPAAAKACEQGTCVEEQSCASFCASGCCDAAGQCKPYTKQDSLSCGDLAASCAPCPSGSGCASGKCVGGATWELWAISASLAAKKTNGKEWDNSWVADPRPDPYFGIGHSWATWPWQFANTSTLQNTFVPQWNEKVTTWSEGDLTDPNGVIIRVLDDDLGTGVNDTIGECKVIFTAADLKAGEYNTTCGDGVTALKLKFVAASSS